MAVLPPAAPGCASCAARDELIAEQGQAIGELKADVLALAEEIRELRRQLGRNSGNSSMAPSADDLPGRTAPEPAPRRAGGERKPGKQPGAPGAHLAWNDHPDTTVPHFPQGRCECGDTLAAARDLGVRYSHQVTDLPEARARTTQHD